MTSLIIKSDTSLFSVFTSRAAATMLVVLSWLMLPVSASASESGPDTELAVNDSIAPDTIPRSRMSVTRGALFDSITVTLLQLDDEYLSKASCTGSSSSTKIFSSWPPPSYLPRDRRACRSISDHIP